MKLQIPSASAELLFISWHKASITVVIWQKNVSLFSSHVLKSFTITNSFLHLIITEL